MGGTSLLVFCLAVSINDALGNGLKNFLTAKLNEFPRWIKENNLDPYPVEEGPIQLTTTRTSLRWQVDLSLRNMYLTDIAPPKRYEMTVYQADTKTKTIEFDLLHTLKWNGEFAINGSVYLYKAKDKIESGGKWWASGNSDNTFAQAVLIENYGVTNGHIDLSQAGSIRFFNSNGMAHSMWPGVTDFRTNPKVKYNFAINAVDGLIKEYLQELDATKTLPANVLIKRFLEEKFQETSLAEIESWK